MSSLITVITAVRNGERHLEQSIKSVIGQTYLNMEYIIIDGASTDTTVKILEKYDPYIHYWTSEPDTGLYDAWNKGIKKATGEWVCFLGSDDFFAANDAVEKMILHLELMKRQGKTYVYGKAHMALPETLKRVETIGVAWSQCRKKFRKKMNLLHCGAFHHRSMLIRHGDFDTRFKIAGDYEYLLREYLFNENFAAFIDLPIVTMRMGGLSNMLENRLLLAKENILARRLNNIKGVSVPIVMSILRVWIYRLILVLFGQRLAYLLADAYRQLLGKTKKWSY